MSEAAFSQPADVSAQEIVAVCIVTYGRPELLRMALTSVQQLRFTRVRRPAVRVLVVDNEGSASTARLVRDVATNSLVPIEYRVEQPRNIAGARNRALEECSTAAAVAFLDDDETADVDWLDELLWVRRTFAAALVVGQVIPAFRGPVPDWAAPAFYSHRTGRLGAPTREGGAGNCLIDARLYRDCGIRFDERFGLAGGEDTHFFRRAAAIGCPPVWAGDAIVVETTPPTRTTMSWLMRRSYRIGVTLAMTDIDVSGPVVGRARRLTIAGGRIAEGLLLLLAAPLHFNSLRKAGAVACLRVARGAGGIAGTLGGRPEAEYRGGSGTARVRA